MVKFQENFDEFVARTGEPFNITTTILASHTMQYFTLGGGDDTGDNYDWNGDGTDETEPFKDKMLMITGLELYAPTAGSASVQFLNIDGKNVLGSIIPGGGVFFWSGRSWGVGDVGPSLLYGWGYPWLCRRRIGLAVATTDDVTDDSGIKISLWGFAVDRRF